MNAPVLGVRTGRNFRISPDLARRAFRPGASMKIPEKINLVGFVSGARPCDEHKVSAATNIFYLRKKEWLDEARNILYKV
jgi:hypothetical protein